MFDWCLRFRKPMRILLKTSEKVSERFPRGFRRFPVAPPPIPRRSAVFSGFRSFQGFPKEFRGFHGFQVLKTMVRRPIDFADVSHFKASWSVRTINGRLPNTVGKSSTFPQSRVILVHVCRIVSRHPCISSTNTRSGELSLHRLSVGLANHRWHTPMRL